MLFGTLSKPTHLAEYLLIPCLRFIKDTLHYTLTSNYIYILHMFILVSFPRSDYVFASNTGCVRAISIYNDILEKIPSRDVAND